jgi:nicotinate-nucleotide pyrophosphorylase (carboxylating)
VERVERIGEVTLDRMVDAWLAEDVGRGDRTTIAVVPPDTTGRARIEARGPAVVAGLQVAERCFVRVGGDRVKWLPEVRDGDRVESGDVLARIEGSLAAILTAERTALNILQRLSAIATLTARFVAETSGTNAQVVDTRKTTPGLRLLEKHAVAVAGGRNHRFGLDDGILVKDNHIQAAGSVTEATKRAVAGAPHGLLIEVEVQNLDELDEAIAAGAHAVLLDNMTPDGVRAAVERAGGRVLLEASGGINLDTTRAFAGTGVDLISVGALTHSAPAVDLALEVED